MLSAHNVWTSNSPHSSNIYTHLLNGITTLKNFSHSHLFTNFCFQKRIRNWWKAWANANDFSRLSCQQSTAFPFAELNFAALKAISQSKKSVLSFKTVYNNSNHSKHCWTIRSWFYPFIAAATVAIQASSVSILNCLTTFVTIFFQCSAQSPITCLGSVPMRIAAVV